MSSHHSRLPRSLVGGAVVALALMLAVGLAWAESVRSKGRVAVRSRPGEQARIVVRVKPNTEMQVIDRDGRWLKVKVDGKVGWVTRTSVREGGGNAEAGDQADRPDRRDRDRDRERDRRDRRRDRDRNRDRNRDREVKRSSWAGDNTPGGAMKVEIAVNQTSAFEKPNVNASVVFTAKQGEDLAVLSKDKNGDWFLVQGPDGKRGWIPAAAVGDPSNLTQARPDPEAGDGGDTGGATAVVDEKKEDKEPSKPAPPAEMQLRAGAGLGFGLFALDYGAANATANGSAAGIALAGELLYPLSSSLWVGADLSYLALQGFGFSYTQGTAEAVDVGFRVFDLDFAAKAGYAVMDSLAVWLRAGLYYNSLFVTDIGALPREELYGPAAGLGVDYRLTDKIAASAQFSLMFAGSRAQTETLEDGADISSAGALWGKAAVFYQLTDDYVVDASYRYLGMSTEWTGASNHIAGQMNTTRDDTAHVLSLGLHTSF